MEILIILAVVVLCIWIGAHIIVGLINFGDWLMGHPGVAFILFGLVVMVFFWGVTTFAGHA